MVLGGDVVNICNEFDKYMRELFEVEPPLGKFDSILENVRPDLDPNCLKL